MPCRFFVQSLCAARAARPIFALGEAQARRSLGHNDCVRRSLVAIVLLVLALSLAAAEAAQAKAPLTRRLAQALAVPGNSPASSSALAIDLATGHTLFARNPDASLAPASNEKLLVMYTALVELGTSYHFRTAVLSTGHQEGTTWHGNVYLKGYGDPTLTSLQLERLAVQLKLAGIRQVQGRILGDESWFDSVRTAPGWKAAFFLTESPPLSALVVDRDFYDGHIALQPALAAAGRFRQLLRKHGITSRSAGLGSAPPSAYGLAQVESAPLPAILREMGVESDNFVAELILKDIGAETGDAGTTAAGAVVTLRDLAAAGVPLVGLRMLDGSGLSIDDRLTARALTTLLEVAWKDADLRRTFAAALPVAGVSGTLEDRMQLPPARGVVRAKTGTTNRASALSGYVRDRYVFAVIQNGFPVAAWPARKAQDRFATALASTL
jgi:D-alanyl-D-alanine carboxypeptidase/D-alanyl-D-alanine-endopeptidase (penicillin-binding protein 4)